MTTTPPTGSSADILSRVKQLIPKRWFAWVAPYRDALLGGLSDSASWGYGLIGYARAQTRLATAYGVFLDILCYDFLGRNLQRAGTPDDTFRAVIRATVLQERVTRAGMINAVTLLTGTAPSIFEPWNTFDTGAYSAAPGRGPQYGSMGYGVGRGGYGSMILPAQVFMQVFRSGPSGIPGVGGYGNNEGGYGVGALSYAGPTVEQSGVTNQMIETIINLTKPTGSTMWIAFAAASNPILLSSEGGTLLTDETADQLNLTS
jgi:hypothetical protein